MSDPVAAQLEAFNAHDLDAFAACYATEPGSGFPQGEVHAVVLYHVAGDVIDHVRVIQ